MQAPNHTFLEETMLHEELAIFAARHSVPVTAAWVLPALFDKVAQETGKSVRGLVSAATYDSQELGDYLAQIAKEVAAKAA